MITLYPPGGGKPVDVFEHKADGMKADGWTETKPKTKEVKDNADSK